MVKRMSDAGCKMGSFKVAVTPAPAARTPAASARKKAAPKATPGAGSETPSGGLKGFRHMPSATPVSSRTVAKQPKLEEVKLAAQGKRAHGQVSEQSAGEEAGFQAATGATAMGGAARSAGMARVPSVLRPVPGQRGSVEDREGSPVSCGEEAWTREDDRAILRLAEVTRGDFVWVARAMRPVRFADQVAQRYKQ